MTGTVLSQEAGRSSAVEFSVPLYMDAQRIIYKSPVLSSDIAGFIKPYTSLVSPEEKVVSGYFLPSLSGILND